MKPVFRAELGAILTTEVNTQTIYVRTLGIKDNMFQFRHDMKVNSNIQLCFIGTHIDLHVPRNGHDELNSVKCVETDELCTARLESFMPFISQRVS